MSHWCGLPAHVFRIILFTFLFGGLPFSQAFGAVPCNPVPGGDVDPCTIPKYVTNLVIPPVMKNTGTADNYDIAVRQFKQQILPGGHLSEGSYEATTVWSYGPTADPEPNSKSLGGKAGVAPAPNSQFNYPALTLETTAHTPVNIRWVNDLVDAQGNYLPHLLPVDQTVHWANPVQVCMDGTTRTDCAGTDPEHYKGPVPIITHVHGAHVGPESDGYPEAWYLPAAGNLSGFATHGTLFDDITGANPGNAGYVDFRYPNDQPASTLWYHDHSLGITRLNVYAGPAGFYLIRGGDFDGATDSRSDLAATLPGPAPAYGEDPNFTADTRNKIREIPIAIQDRSFEKNGRKLFYPKHRAFFEGLKPRDLKIDTAPDSDVLPTWQPEAFFNVMVVNGVSWPKLEVVRDRYRLRLLNGCNSRFLNLALKIVTGPGADGINGTADDVLGAEIPIYQIGAEQGFLPKVVKIVTGHAVELPGNGDNPDLTPAEEGQALLMGLAERADVIVDFSELAPGTHVRLINTAPDEPFGGELTAANAADPGTTGQVMEFVVNDVTDPVDGSTDDSTTPPEYLKLNAEGPLGPVNSTASPRAISLNEENSFVVCVLLDNATGEFAVPIKQVDCFKPAPAGFSVVPFGPIEALLGTVDLSDPEVPLGISLKWTDNSGVSTPATVNLNNGKMVMVGVTENPEVGKTEEWDIYNFTADAHPIHLHLVRFEVVHRRETGTTSPIDDPLPWEKGYKDTVIAYPGQVTRVKARFDVEGLYVWHCHIVEHEDNEMMRPYCVGDCSAVD